jgi:5,10-methylene-tetrahydrofolate dehydrogenase/methenyl tetrahydrofolate cyclohydrolase
MDENEKNTLQSLVEYYRNKCNQLEHDFVQYQIKAESVVRELNERIQQAHEHPEEEDGDGAECL